MIHELAFKILIHHFARQIPSLPITIPSVWDEKRFEWREAKKAQEERLGDGGTLIFG